MYNVLSQLRGVECTNSQKKFFNGYLSDFLAENRELNEETRTVFQNIADKDEDIRICADYPLDIREEVVANQVIRYKDAFKIPNSYLTVPYIIYWQKEEASKAIIISDTTYVEAKGMYFLLTEPGSRFADYRNEVVACCSRNIRDVAEIFDAIYQQNRSVGSVQRYYDRKYIINADEMKDKCVELGRKISEDAQKRLLEVEDKSDTIYTTVGRIFLIKKALYVQYMMSKDILVDRHENDVKKQRQFAKAYVDEIEIISYSQMWRLTADNQQQEKR